MRLHDEILSEEQRALLPKLGVFANSYGFWLGGGTAVALHLGHRRSVDFDLFADEDAGDPLVLAAKAREQGITVEAARTARGTLHALFDGVHVSFLEYLYPNLSEPAVWPDLPVRLASLDDLACMKLGAIAQRGSRKDFIDLYAIALQHRSLGEIMDLYRDKYRTSEIGHLLIGLTYFDDADPEPSPVMLRDIPWERVKRQFVEWAKALA